MPTWITSLVCALLLSTVASAGAAETSTANGPVRSLKITLLSTMLADGKELGEWGFAALVEVDGHRILVDTGAHRDVVLKNAQTLGVDLTNVPDVVITHHHWDHVGGLLTLRDAVQPKAPDALARVHVGEGAFAPRTSIAQGIESNPLLILRPDYEKSGGTFITHAKPVQLYPGVWLTGPVPRKHPERNWSAGDRIKTASGLVEDNLPEDQALIFDTEAGLVALFGCGHAGIINTLEYARAFIRPARIHAVIGGIHVFNATDETLQWTAEKLAGFGLDHFIGAHCTGIEPVYRFRFSLGLDRQHAVVGAVGASFTLGQGIAPRAIAK